MHFHKYMHPHLSKVINLLYILPSGFNNQHIFKAPNPFTFKSVNNSKVQAQDQITFPKDRLNMTLEQVKHSPSIPKNNCEGMRAMHLQYPLVLEINFLSREGNKKKHRGTSFFMDEKKDRKLLPRNSQLNKLSHHLHHFSYVKDLPIK